MGSGEWARKLNVPHSFEKGYMQRVLAVLQEGVQSPEHAAFVQKLGSLPPTMSHEP